jgi:hypothetical protein
MTRCLDGFIYILRTGSRHGANVLLGAGIRAISGELELMTGRVWWEQTYYGFTVVILSPLGDPANSLPINRPSG